MHSLKIVGRGPPAHKLGGRDYLSFSAVSTFAACPLKFYFRYVAGIPEEIVSASLVFGSAFHAGLEHHFRELMVGNPAPDLDTLLGVFWDCWRDRAEERTVQFARGDNVSAVGDMARRMFLAFQASDLACPAGTIIAIEEEVRGQLIPGLPDLLARLDLVIDTRDCLTLTDFKTARSGWNDAHVDDSSSQLLLYHHLIKDWADGRPVRLGFAVFSKTKVPQVELHPVVVDHRQIERTKRIVERVWRAIQAGHFFPNPSPINCATCPYRGPCRDWAG